MAEWSALVMLVPAVFGMWTKTRAFRSSYSQLGLQLHARSHTKGLSWQWLLFCNTSSLRWWCGSEVFRGLIRNIRLVAVGATPQHLYQHAVSSLRFGWHRVFDAQWHSHCASSRIDMGRTTAAQLRASVPLRARWLVNRFSYPV